ncbi:putative disease resistance protein isoform X2 [Gossypium australe]|uniref:Putative disease resistance protein isoform X2 n=1 Tax=Gossypium australe TaxID=47621 RepID=A0A5B6X4B9_9ROSI|nr:putative disease resistance protein isoform X2 [Gossypium australe]
MAVEFATSSAANVLGDLMIESLLKPTTRKLDYIFCFSNTVLDWHNAADEAQKDVQALENEIQETRTFSKCCPSWSYRYRLSN